MKKRSVLLSLLLSLVAALLGTSFSIHSTITPDKLGDRAEGLYADGWIANDAQIKLEGFSPLGNRIVFHFDPWRPDTVGPALLTVTLCGEAIATLEVKDTFPVIVPLTRNCDARKLTFTVQNPFTPSETDQRALAVQFKEITIQSRLGIPIVDLSQVVHVMLFIALIALLWGYALKNTVGPSLVILLPLVGGVMVSRIPDLHFMALTSLALFLAACGLGAALAAWQRSDAAERIRPVARDHRSSEVTWSVIALGAVLVGLLLRLWGIGFGLPATFHPDEVPKVNAVMRMVERHTLDPDYFLHPSMLLYTTYAMNSLFHLIGVAGDFRDTMFLAGRMVSVVAGSFSIYLTFLIGRRIFSPQGGAIGALCLAVFPLHVTCSRYLKEDALLTAFVLATVLATVRAAQSGKGRSLLLAGFLAGLTASTKYTGILAIIPVASAPWLRSRSLLPDRSLLTALPFALLIAPIGFLAGTPYAVLNSARFIKHFNYERAHMERGHTGSIDAWSQYWMYYYERAITPGITWFVTALASIGI